MLVDGPADSGATFLFAHGAGAPMDHDWMNAVTAGLVEAGVRVIRSEFPHMAVRRVDGKRRGPDRPAVLEATWLQRIGEAGGGGEVFVGGKSMGGRVASIVADAAGARGLVCLGYPFHAPGKPEKTRTEHLAGLTTPAMIVQGERDTFAGARRSRATTFRPGSGCAGWSTATIRSSRVRLPGGRWRTTSPRPCPKRLGSCSEARRDYPRPPRQGDALVRAVHSFDDCGDDFRFGQGGDITDVVWLAFGDLAEDAAHDLAGTCFWKSGTKWSWGVADW